MTHTNHREGSVESLCQDFVVFMYTAKGFNEKDCGPKLQRFLRICIDHGAVNYGTPKVGNLFTASTTDLVEGVVKAEKVYTVFDRQEAAMAALKDIAKADLGISVVVSGLHDKVAECCRAAGIKRHTVEYSLGVWGKTEKLPDPAVLQITTMCGHGHIAFNLVKRLARDVRRGALTVEEAAATLAKPCVCGVFNPTRAAAILTDYLAAEGTP